MMVTLAWPPPSPILRWPSRLTSWHARAQLNPPPGLPVLAGPVYAGERCNIPG